MRGAFRPASKSVRFGTAEIDRAFQIVAVFSPRAQDGTMQTNQGGGT